MECFRLVRQAYADQLTGIGAARYGARWNSKGVELIYTASSRALALAEVVVHFSLATMPDDYRMLSLWIPDAQAPIGIHQKDLPALWNTFPHSSKTQAFGDAFAREGKALLLRVPSAVVQGDYNLLINPRHPAFPEVKVVENQAFPIDRRLFEA